MLYPHDDWLQFQQSIITSVLLHYTHLENVGYDCSIFFGGGEKLKSW